MLALYVALPGVLSLRFVPAHTPPQARRPLVVLGRLPPVSVYSWYIYRYLPSCLVLSVFSSPTAGRPRGALLWRPRIRVLSGTGITKTSPRHGFYGLHPPVSAVPTLAWARLGRVFLGFYSHQKWLHRFTLIHGPTLLIHSKHSVHGDLARYCSPAIGTGASVPLEIAGFGGWTPKGRHIRSETRWKCGCGSADDLGIVWYVRGVFKGSWVWGLGRPRNGPCPRCESREITPQTHYLPPWLRLACYRYCKAGALALGIGQVFQDKGKQGGS